MESERSGQGTWPEWEEDRKRFPPPVLVPPATNSIPVPTGQPARKRPASGGRTGGLATVGGRDLFGIE